MLDRERERKRDRVFFTQKTTKKLKIVKKKMFLTTITKKRKEPN